MLEAARIGDQVTHSDAKSGSFWGAVTGALLGAAVVGLAVVAGVFTFGTGTVVVLAVGAALLGAGIGSKMGEAAGRKVPHPVGPIISGSHTVFVGPGNKGAARAHADVAACKDHAPSDSALQDAGKIGKRIAQGSGTVNIEGFPAARMGDRGTCEFVIGEGCPTVFIGGPTVTTDLIDPEVSDTIHKAQKYAINVGLMMILRVPPSMIGAWLVTDEVSGRIWGEGSWQQTVADLVVPLGPSAVKGMAWLVQAAGRRLATQEVAQVTEQRLVQSTEQRLTQQAERQVIETPTGGRGPVSGRPFDPDAAGGPIRNLDYTKARITPKGVDVVEQHLQRFNNPLAQEEEGMLSRLRRISTGELEAEPVDQRFYTHELREFTRYRNLGYSTGQPAEADAAYDLWNNTHTATLEDFGLKEGPGVLYHPDVVSGP